MATFFFFAALAASTALVLHALYIRLLPKPIPGIPHHEDSAKSILGDAAYFIELERTGQYWTKFFFDLVSTCKSPIAQYFPGPFSRSHVVIADYREAQDLMSKRSRELGRGYTNNETWKGVVPDHFIAMETFHPSFKDTKFLTKDLMAPTFLHGVSAPASFRTISNFIRLWKLKATMAKGLPFEAGADLEGLTYDIMMSAAFGIPEEDSNTVNCLRALQAAGRADILQNGSEQLASFPLVDNPELLTALRVLDVRVTKAFDTTFPNLFYFFDNFRPSVRRAFESKRAIIQSHIDRSVKKSSGNNSSKEQYASAVDYVVSRERSAAESAGRQPIFKSPRLIDMLWGYLVGGQDSTHSTLSFTVKYLAKYQDVQSKLRQALRLAYPEAHEQQREPVLEEIIKTQVPFLDAVIEETLRMCSPAASVMKEALCDITVLGHVVPKGTPIMFMLTGPTFTESGAGVEETKRSETSQKQSNESPDDWAQTQFPPEEFHAERWLKPDESGEEKFNNKAGPFMSFSNGPRGCWGKRLAYLELKLIVTMLVWDLEFLKLPTELEDDGLIQGLFTKPKSCLVKLKSTSGLD